MNITVHRIYEPIASDKSFRVLVDGLWPRGISKANAHIDLWAKEIAPSRELRSWFHVDKERRFNDFTKKYRRELSKNLGLASLRSVLRSKKNITIVTGVKDIKHSHIPILLKRLGQ